MKKFKVGQQSEISIPKDIDIFQPFTQVQFATLCGVSKTAVNTGIKAGKIKTTADKKILLIDNSGYLTNRMKNEIVHMSQSQREGVLSLLERIRIARQKKHSAGDKIFSDEKQKAIGAEFFELAEQAKIADLKNIIYSAKIKEEKAEQECLRTQVQKKELAPIYLLKHFFSFAENIIQRSYRRFEEISPELEALYLAGKSQEAVKLLKREQEAVSTGAVSDLQKAIKEEEYSITPDS